MTLDMSSLGRLIASARKAQGLSQKELAELVLKEDGAPITPQYLNDIEHDRRNPSSDHIVRQFAKVLKIPADRLFAVAGVLPEDARNMVKKSTPEKVDKALVAFRKAIRD
jgi:transcriptional regulator with XRE-family HTH domain